MMILGIISSDLISIEGVCNCWRYTCELDEFRKMRSFTVLPTWQSFMHIDLPKAELVRFPALSLQNQLSTPIHTLAVHGVPEQQNSSPSTIIG